MASERYSSEGQPPLSRVALTAFLAALATVHVSRRLVFDRFVVGESPEVLTRDQALRALERLPKPLLLHCAVRSDGSVRLYTPRTALAQQVQDSLAETTRKRLQYWRELWELRHAERGDGARILVQAPGDEILLSRAELEEFMRDYHLWGGGYAIHVADEAARALGADLVLMF